MLVSATVVVLLTLTSVTHLEAPASLTRARTPTRNHSAQSETNQRAEELFQEALILSNTKERELARARLREAMQLWMLAPQAEKAGSAALQMGDRYAQAAMFQEALYWYEEALSVRGLDVQMRAAAHNSIAKLYAGLYQRDLAVSNYRQAMHLTRTSLEGSARALALTGLADIYHREGDKKQTLACLGEARKLSARNRTAAEAALTYLAGLIDLEEGNVERALQSFEEALAIYREVGNALDQIKVICSISNLYLASGQTQQAVEKADRAVELAELEAARMVDISSALRAAEMRWRAWFSHARTHRAAGEKETAIKSFGRAIFQLEGLYWSVYIATETSAVAFREELQAPYRELVDLLAEQGETEKAFEWAERARARVVLGMSEARRMKGQVSRDDEEARRRELSQSAARLRAQLATQVNRKERARLEARIKRALEAMDEARSKLEMQRSRERLVWFQPAGIKTLRDRLARTGEAVLEFLVGENRSFAWLVSSQGLSLEILPGRKEIEKQFTAFMEVITAAPNNPQLKTDLTIVRERGERLLLTLFGRLYEQIPRGEKLIVVPDRLLHNLPFEALIHDGHYLLEDHEISYVPSASMLGLWRESKVDPATEDKMDILAFGDPSFGPEPKTTGKKTSRVRHRNIMRQARASRGFQLPSLPRTRDEVLYIRQLFPPERGRVYLGKDATEEAVKRESLRRFRRLHFATHSLIDEVSPSRAAVTLSLDSDPEEDGFLEVSEISELDLDCDVVVLSACQTGRGQLLSGEGIVGLSRAFLYAGARAVVVSLWNVSDISTGQLMKSFYRDMTAGLSNAAALREAKLQMLKSDKETRHPYYWASFVIVGQP